MKAKGVSIIRCFLLTGMAAQVMKVMKAKFSILLCFMVMMAKFNILCFMVMGMATQAMKVMKAKKVSILLSMK